MMNDNYRDFNFEHCAQYSNVSAEIDQSDPSQRTYGDVFKKPFFSNIYFYIKNKQYEVVIMWGIIIVTIIVFLSLMIKDAEDEAETQQTI